MNENEQKTLENGEKPEEEFYRCTHAKSEKGFLEKLNEHAKEGYKPIWDTLDFITRDGVNSKFIYLYNSDVSGLINSKDDIELIEAMDMAEGYVIETSTSLSDEKNRLLIDTDYDIVNAKRQAQDPPLPPVKTAPEKKAWVESQLTERENDSLEAKRWKKYVEAMAKRGELPQRESPWDKKARLKEEEMRLKEEKASQVVSEKVQDMPVKGEG